MPLPTHDQPTLTIRAVLVKTGERECDKCCFRTVIACNGSKHIFCGIKHVKVADKAQNECQTGYWTNI